MHDSHVRSAHPGSRRRGGARPLLVLMLLGALVLGVLPSASAHDGVSGVAPATVDAAMDPGDSDEVEKVVHTSAVPPKPDIVFLADTTGSMGSEIANVKSNVASIMADVTAAQPNAQFGAAQYRDFNCDPQPFNLDQAITDDTAAVQTAVNTWGPMGGCDEPEAQLFALHELATSAATGFRPESSRIIVWFGDAPGHDPSNGITEAAATSALQAAAVRVLAISTGFNRLNLTGQAARIADATGGIFTSGVAPSDLSAAILAGLQAIEVTVTPTPGPCDDGLAVAFSPTEQTVTSGDDATFTETIAVAADAPQGTTLTCTVRFLVDGQDSGPEFTQTITVDVNDVTPPEAACTPTTNPSGRTIPRAGGVGSSGQNPDGYYELSAHDAVDAAPAIYLVDTGSGTVFGPFEDGTRIKYTQNASEPGMRAHGSDGSAVQWRINGNGDAQVHAVDASGNESDRHDCLVPAPPR
jgi:hypothetical protein